MAPILTRLGQSFGFGSAPAGDGGGGGGEGGAIEATGGTKDSSSRPGWTFHKFLYSAGASQTFTITSGSGNIEYLIVGGGGGGAVAGGPNDRPASGGGGGGYRTQPTPLAVTPGT